MIEIFLNNVSFIGYRNDQEGVDMKAQDISHGKEEIKFEGMYRDE